MDRPHIVQAWLLELLVTRAVAGGLAVPAPVLARVYALLADAVAGYEQCRKVKGRGWRVGRGEAGEGRGPWRPWDLERAGRPRALGPPRLPRRRAWRALTPRPCPPPRRSPTRPSPLPLPSSWSSVRCPGAQGGGGAGRAGAGPQPAPAGSPQRLVPRPRDAAPRAPAAGPAPSRPPVLLVFTFSFPLLAVAFIKNKILVGALGAGGGAEGCPSRAWDTPAGSRPLCGARAARPPTPRLHPEPAPPPRPPASPQAVVLTSVTVATYWATNEVGGRGAGS
jgi:hypothetical protein